MFSTNAASNPTLASLRNPRRRQRTNSDEGVKPPKAKRQRSTRRRDDDSKPEIETQTEEQSRELDREPEKSIVETQVKHGALHELPLRGPRKTEGYSSHAGTSTLLVSIQLKELYMQRLAHGYQNIAD